MRITIIAIGKVTPAVLEKQQREYEKRLVSHAEIIWRLLPSSRESLPAKIVDDESATILKTLQPRDTVILLDETGALLTNEEFVQKFYQYAGRQGQIVFLIGGAYGVSSEVRARAQFVWSFSPLVFPHQLIRIMLLEQLYRTFKIAEGHPYHHS